MVSSYDCKVKAAGGRSAAFAFEMFSVLKLFLLRFYFGPEAVKVAWIRLWNLAFASGDVGLCLLKLTNEIIVRAVVELAE